MVSSPKPTLAIYGPQGGVVLQISNYRDDQMGAKIKTPKNPMPIFRAIKISRATLTTRPGYTGTIMNLQIVLNTRKNSYLNQATQNFPTQTKSRNQKFPTLKKSFDHPCNLKSGAPPAPPLRVMDPGTYKHFILTFVKQTPQSPRWTLFLGYRRIDSINKVAVTLSNL